MGRTPQINLPFPTTHSTFDSAVGTRTQCNTLSAPDDRKPSLAAVGKGLIGNGLAWYDTGRGGPTWAAAYSCMYWRQRPD